jgi:translation initiation factor IF-2
MEPEKKQITLPRLVTVNELAEVLKVPVTRVIKQLLTNGVLASINDNLDFDTAAVIASDLGFDASPDETEKATADTDVLEIKHKAATSEHAILRAPIVTILGHVDHGKTTLLDYIRKTKVVEGESGGITQHMGAYQVEYKGRKMTFLDTPGHEAFSTIRAQGTRVTDVAVVVVAGEEGLKPQTIEAIELARAANVPIVVAITKMDKPEANPLRVKQELAAHNIVTEEWGGKDVVVGVSSKTGQGVDDLLELILLTADLQELKADAEGLATGVLIEAKHDPKVGYTGTLIVQNGKLKIGDPFVVGSNFGKIKSMEDHTGRRVKEAGPATPVKISGFTGTPQAGEVLRVADSDKEARDMATDLGKKSTSRRIGVSDSDLSKLTAQIRASQSTNLNIVLKADVQGSMEAIKNQLAKIKTDKGAIVIVSEGLGNIAESDVLAAAGEKAFVIGFKVVPSASATTMAKKDDVKILTYDIIYELTDDLAKILLDSIAPDKVETIQGKATVLKIFKDDRNEKIIGMKVVSGEGEVGDIVRFSREDEQIAEGTIKKIQQLTNEVRKADAGNEYGFLIATTAKGIAEEDVAEFVRIDMKKAKLILQ